MNRASVIRIELGLGLLLILGALVFGWSPTGRDEDPSPTDSRSGSAPAPASDAGATDETGEAGRDGLNAGDAQDTAGDAQDTAGAAESAESGGRPGARTEPADRVAAGWIPAETPLSDPTREVIPTLTDGLAQALDRLQGDRVFLQRARVIDFDVQFGSHDWMYGSLARRYDLTGAILAWLDSEAAAGVERALGRPAFIEGLHTTPSLQRLPYGQLIRLDNAEPIGRKATSIPPTDAVIELDVRIRVRGVQPMNYFNRNWICRAEYVVEAKLIDSEAATQVWFNNLSWDVVFRLDR